MASFVNAADAIAAAVEIERRGHIFYKKVEEKAASAPDRDFFAFMAGEEKRHEKVFSAMLARAGGLSLPAGSDDEEYLTYVKGLLDSHTLFMPDQESRALYAPLQEAIRLEKDTLVFFLELEKMVPESEKNAVRECAEEERRHLRMLIRRI
jgi:rubrerythrin